MVNALLVVQIERQMVKRLKRKMTMLDLIQVVQRNATSDHDVVVQVTRLVNSGRVILCGNFAFRRL
jgi:hypothetical protein